MRFIRKAFFAGMSAIPMLPLMAGSYIVSKDSSFWLQLVFRYTIPPIATNIYLFGFSKYVATLAPCFKEKPGRRNMEIGSTRHFNVDGSEMSSFVYNKIE